MEINLNKDDFSNKSFDAANYLNKLFITGKAIPNSDLLSFKLKIIQREINSDIDMSSNSVIKSGPLLKDDLKLVNNLQYAVKQKINKTFEKERKNNKKEEENEFNIKIIENNLKDIEKMNKAIEFIKK